VIASISESLSGEQRDAIRSDLRSIASIAAGLPVRVFRNDVYEVYERARVVKNVVEPDPDVPTLAEVREMLDQPLESSTDAATPAGDVESATGNDAQ
jgi:hypothetical protein